MTNRLIDATSPYLRQHAENPVDWYPWGDEALTRARELNRPIFLSVGYSSCHWCHVMERESFENPAIAELMNRHFVNIKVDREERPDIDSTYMMAVQLMTGQGGWPMSVFLTPDLRPFWGGTYFPPDSRWGRPGFGAILASLAKAWTDKPDEIESSASTLTERIAAKPSYGGDELPGTDALERASTEAESRFDPMFGGFGSAPKFPRSVEISLLLRVYARGGDAKVLEMCEQTLEHMAYGGIYDQLGGGFHRYSVDAQWLVPHFEKMLYDNALLAQTYLDAFQLTRRDLWERIARETLDWVLRDMTSPEGGFYSATDADSGGSEGTFFVWTPEAVEAVLGAEDARVFCRYFDVSETGNFEGKSILHISHALESLARAEGIELEAVQGIIDDGRRQLLAARDRREKPFRDEKALTAWNALMISAFARGAQVLDDARYRDAAVRAADLVLEHMRSASGTLLRVRKDGRSDVLGFLDDHAYFVAALIDLWETTFDPRWLRAARELADIVLAEFVDDEDGGFWFTSRAHEAVLARRRDDLDNATPAPGAVLALALARLERLTGEAAYRDAAEAFLRSIAGVVEQMSMASSMALMALDFLAEPPVEIAVVGDPAPPPPPAPGGGGGPPPPPLDREPRPAPRRALRVLAGARPRSRVGRCSGR